MPQLLKAACLEPVLPNERSHRNEKRTHHDEEKPALAATRESRAQQRRPSMAKNTNLSPPQIMLTCSLTWKWLQKKRDEWV